MSRRKPKVDKVSLHISIPREILEEADYYIENYSQYFTAVLRKKIESEHKKQLQREDSNEAYITQNSRRNGNMYSPTLSIQEQQDVEYEKLLSLYKGKKEETISEQEYDELIAEFKEMRRRYIND